MVTERSAQSQYETACYSNENPEEVSPEHISIKGLVKKRSNKVLPFIDDNHI